MACSCSLKLLFILFIVSGALFVLSLILAFVVFPIVLDNEVNKATRLEEGTEQYDRFVELPFPIDFKVFIYNVNNPDEILEGAKPNVTERGPYIYKQYRHKKILSTSDDEDTITYEQTETFEFDAAASYPLTEDDLITVLNPPLMSIYQLAEDFGLAGAVSNCVSDTFLPGYGDIFIKLPIRQLLFEGFNFCKNTATGLCGLVNDVVCAIASTKRNSDLLPDYSLQFSMLNYKVRAPDGRYTVNRGLDNIDLLGHIMAWNDRKYTDYWGEGTTCSRVKGTDSTLYPPRVQTDSKFYIFSTDICRFVGIDYMGEASYKNVDGYLFGTNPKTLYSSMENPEDDCYCSKLSRDANGDKTCFLDGLIDMQTCFGVPVLFSFPHFLWADEKYLNGVDGLKPDENIHNTYLIVEPNTGTPLQGVKRIQLNAVLRPIPGIKSLLSVQRLIFPLLWIEEGVALTDKYVDELNSQYFDKVVILEGVEWSLVALTALLTVGFCVFAMRKRFYQRND